MPKPASAGRALQRELVERVRNHGMRMVGPNCMGLLNASADGPPQCVVLADLAAERPASRCLSQSGALGIAILELAHERSSDSRRSSASATRPTCRATICCSTGKATRTTSVILLYLESFGNPRRFARIARRIGRSKPIVAVKAGRTRGGSRAAGSHTAALAASDVAVDALFQQTGVIRADTIDEMFDIAAVPRLAAAARRAARRRS